MKNKEQKNTGEEEKSWREQLPEDLRENEAFSGFDDIGRLGKEYLALKENSLTLPGEDAGDEEWAEFFKKAGRPEKGEEYDIKKPGDLPGDFAYNEALENAFRGEALRLNLTNKQAKGLFDWYLKNMGEAHETMQGERERQHEEAVATMKKEFGARFDENVELARRAVRTFGGEGLVKLLDETRLGDHPAVVRTFLNMAQAVSDDKLVDGTVEAGEKENKLSGFYPTMKKKEE